MSEEQELLCPQCDAAEVCGSTQMIARLRSVGVLRREADPPATLLAELFRHNATKFACHVCDHVGLQVREPTVEDWDVVKRCSVCGTRIPQERLDLFPDAQRCARCESQTADSSPAEREFCPNCGEVMTVRLRRGTGIAKYEMTCPRCRR